MAKINFQKASAAQLVSFATTRLGLEIDGTPKASDVRALISATGFTGDEIEVDDTIAGAGRAPLTVNDVAGRKLVRINIPVQEAVAGGSDAVPIGVNGTVARIMRGVDVDVPVEYVEVLKNAQKMIYDRGPNSELINPRLTPIYPFSIIAILD